MVSREGSGSYAILRAASVLTAIGAVLLAIVVWAAPDQPRLGYDAFGELTITEDPGAAKVIAGVTILVIGLIQAALFWAVGTIGDHMIRVRSLLEPSTPTTDPRMTTVSPPTGAIYQLVITNAGSRPDRVVKAVRDSFGIDEAKAQQALGGGTLLTGGYATVEGARMAIQAAGGQAETVEAGV